ncbi:hypothetical protein QGP82_18715 [Leptothoe sp. LEGE 181152]|nr:hypothetical protein [Leptothoe sp. LEGE 181152]
MVTASNSNVGSQGFSEYTGTDGTCINPAHLAQFFEDMGQALNAAVCSGRLEDRVFVLTKFQEFSNVIDTLVDQDGFADQVAQLQNLINTLQDQDGDGVNDLQQVKDRLDALESSYNQQQQQLSQHGQSIANLQTTQATQGQQLATLQSSIDNLDWETLGLDPNQIRCEAVTDIYNAVQAGFNAFSQQLSIDCVLPTSLDDVNDSELPAGEETPAGEDVPDTL